MTDSISDFFIRIKNGYMARKESIDVPLSKMKKEITEILVKNNYLAKYETTGKEKKNLKLYLFYQNEEPRLTDLTIVSKPSRRVYVKHNAIPKVLGGLGIGILTTPTGIMTDKQARKAKSGGELLCKLW